MLTKRQQKFIDTLEATLGLQTSSETEALGTKRVVDAYRQMMLDSHKILDDIIGRSGGHPWAGNKYVLEIMDELSRLVCGDPDLLVLLHDKMPPRVAVNHFMFFALRNCGDDDIKARCWRHMAALCQELGIAIDDLPAAGLRGPIRVR